ncbi:MAG TPA: HAD-IIB family hydrolase [bacterium]|nr:HAD-IIB family hydrolase [bacterium]
MKKEGLYIQMISPHGLIRGHSMELGRDADTGGQVKYVIELGKALSRLDGIRQVDLLTRLIADKSVSEDYAVSEEPITDRFRIKRIQCGGRKYIRKELLWPHLDEFVDKAVKWTRQQDTLPDLVHGHYADGGYIAMQLEHNFGIPFVFTGHSLGRAKKEKLTQEGMPEKEMNRHYKIHHRIRIEEEILKFADLIIASTTQEIEKQYGLYKNETVPEYRVIPPGIEIDKFYPFYHDKLPETERTEESMYAQASMIQELERFLVHSDKPLILALCRPDKRKNIDGLIKAYGEDKELQAMANLAIFAGIRRNIVEMEDNERDVLTRMLLMMDKYDLYGKMAIPKQHDFEHEVPELYRIAANKKGVFVNAALTEPFGITLLEAAATGLPFVATRDGGPVDIVRNTQSGILVDPTRSKEIGEAIKKMIADPEKWELFSKNGIMNVRKHYTWESHADTYKKEVQTLLRAMEKGEMKTAVPRDAVGRRLVKLNHFIIVDIDNTLLGGDSKALSRFLKKIHEMRDRVGFGVATGRTVESAIQVLKENSVPSPDVVIASVGSEIYYGENLHYGKGWETHIRHRWDREELVGLLKDFPFLEYQEEEAQRPFKISYYMEPGKDRLAKVHGALTVKKCRYNLIYSHQRYLDVLPYRASKGKAIRYLSYKWGIPLNHFLVCGDSGNDEEMLRGEPLAVVVGNHSPELARLEGTRNVYFANGEYDEGILEGIGHYRFFEKLES